MKENLKLEIATITLWHMCAIVITLVAMTILTMKANKTSTLKAFFKVEVAMLIWMVGKVLKTVAFNVDLRWYCIVLYYGGICLLEVAFLEFGYAYYKGRPMKKSFSRAFYLLAIIQFLVVATNPYHHLFYKTYDFYRDSFGPLFYYHVLIEYMFILAGGIFCSIRFRTHLKAAEPLYKFLVSVAIIAPVIFNLIYISGALRNLFRSLGFAVLFDVTPIVFTWSLLLFIYVTFRYEFFELTPLMRHEIMHELTTPMCILDDDMKLVFVNDALAQVYTLNFYQSVKKLLSEGGVGSEGAVGAFSQKVLLKDHYYDVFVKKIASHKSVAYVATFKDITSYRQLEAVLMKQRNEIDEANKVLNRTIATLKETSKRGARHYVARELHDIIGHSLVVAIKLLEVAKLYYIKEPLTSHNAMLDAVESIDVGIDEMKGISHQDDHSNGRYSAQLLEKELKAMLKHVDKTGMETRLQFKGALHVIEEKTFDVIRRVCTELITNTLKHSYGDHLLLSLQVTKDHINIHFIDDGRGCDGLVYGNGLKGIEYRLGLVGGQVKFATESMDGFSAFIIIPQQKDQ